MSGIGKLADELQPGIRWAQHKLQEVSNYLDNMGPTIRAKAEWQPIETQPIGRWVLVYGDGYCAVAYRNEHTSDQRPWTHWMELPEGPK